MNSVYIVNPETISQDFRLSKFVLNDSHKVSMMEFISFDQDVIKMITHELIVTVENWHEQEECQKIIQIARIMNKTIIHESKFQQYAEQTND